VVVVLAVGRRGQSGAVFYICLGVGLIVLYSLTFGIQAFRRYKRLKVLRSIRPDDLAFSFTARSMTRNDLNVLETQGVMEPVGGPALQDEFYRAAFEASANASGIQLWRGMPKKPYASIPWSMVAKVGTAGVLSDPAVVVTFGDDGKLADFRLPSSTARLIATSYQNDCRFVATRLEELRSRGRST
jgi:hypothetical protein